MSNKGGTKLAGLIALGTGGFSIYANIYSLTIPVREHAETFTQWHAMPSRELTFSGTTSAVLFPLLAIGGVELITRVAHIARIWRYGAIGLAVAIAMYSSYGHIRAVLLWAGQDPFTAGFGPIAVDVMAIFCAVVLLSAAERDTAPDAADTAPADVLDMVAGWTPPHVPAPRPASLSPDTARCPDTVPAEWTPDTEDAWTSDAPVSPAVDMSAPDMSEPLVSVSAVSPVRQDTDTAPVQVDTDTPARPVSWDRDKAIDLIMDTDKSNADIAAEVGIGDKTIQRLRRDIRDGRVTR